MKKKIQHNAVNNQEDEDSCAYSIYFPGDTPVEKKEDVGGRESSGQLFSDASSTKDELSSKGE
jgi:hypothetical protein